MADDTSQDRTGTKATTSGLYHSACTCCTKLEVRAGERLPKCSFCHQPVAWLLVRSHVEDATPPADDDDRRTRRE